MLGNHQHASEMPFKWRFAGGPMMACLKCYLDPPTPHQLKKNSFKVGPPLTKFSRSAHGNCKYRRTSDSLNEGLPIKIARQNFQRKRLFFHQKDSRLNSRIFRKSIFLIGQAPIQKYGLKTLFLQFNI